MKRMKSGTRAVALVLAVLLVAALTACGGGQSGGTGGGSGKDTLTGSLSDIVTAVTKDADNNLTGNDKLPMLMDTPVTADNVQGLLGLSPQDKDTYVSDVAVYMAAISAIAFQVALVKCKDAASAAKVADLIAKGLDPTKWICVMPGQGFVQTSGSYVLLFVGTDTQATAVSAAFKTAAGGNASEPNVFYQFKG